MAGTEDSRESVELAQIDYRLEVVHYTKCKTVHAVYVIYAKYDMDADYVLNKN
jgi:hypothetical protein